MNGFKFNKIPKTIKYSFLLWMAIVAYYLFDIYMIYPMTGQVYNFISPFIIFGVIAIALGLLIYPTFILIRKSFNSLDSKFDIILKLPKLFLFILNNTKLLTLNLVAYLLNSIFDRNNAIDHEIQNIDNDKNDPSKPEGIPESEWRINKMEECDKYNIDYKPFDS